MDTGTAELTFAMKDDFNRKSIAEKVIRLLRSDIDISPMVIDGGWGTGKTEFCHKLINLMEEDNTHSIIYIDAFKADHVDEPLMTVLSEIIKLVPEGPRRKAFINRVLPAVRYVLKTAAKAGVSHLLRQDFTNLTNDFDKEIQKVADDSIDKTAELILKDHVKAKESLKTLQTALTAIAHNDPIIIFIDELDRCRPNFAIDMLEIIKHTFDVKGVNFVLITNTQQLKASIKHCYGQEVDAQLYLDKFLKFSFELSPLSNRDFHSPVLAASDHFFTLAKEKNCLPEITLKQDFFKKAIEYSIKAQNLSLRQIETLVLHLQIAQTVSDLPTFNERDSSYKILLNLVAVMLVCYRPDILKEIKRGTIDANLLGEFLGVDKIPVLEEGSSAIPTYFEFLMVVLAQDCNKNVDKYHITEEQKVRWSSYMDNSYFLVRMPNPGNAIKEIIKTANIMSFE